MNDFQKQHLHPFLEQAERAIREEQALRVEVEQRLAQAAANVALAQSNLSAACALIAGPGNCVDLATLTVVPAESVEKVA